MPPVMTAAAFIMTKIVGMPYTTITATAILPILLFFTSAFIIVHLQAVKSGIFLNAERHTDTRHSRHHYGPWVP